MDQQDNGRYIPRVRGQPREASGQGLNGNAPMPRRLVPVPQVIHPRRYIPGARGQPREASGQGLNGNAPMPRRLVPVAQLIQDNGIYIPGPHGLRHGLNGNAPMPRRLVPVGHMIQDNGRYFPDAHGQPQRALEQGLNGNEPMPRRLVPVGQVNQDNGRFFPGPRDYRFIGSPPMLRRRVPVAHVIPQRRNRCLHLQRLKVMGFLLTQDQDIAPRRGDYDNEPGPGAMDRYGRFEGINDYLPRLPDDLYRNYRLWNNLPPIPDDEDTPCPQLDDMLKGFLWFQLICGLIWTLVSLY